MDTSNEVDAARDAYWDDQPALSLEDVGEHDADVASPPPLGRSFANDFRRRPSLDLKGWHALKQTSRNTRSTPPRSSPRAARHREKRGVESALHCIERGPVDTEPPPPPASPPRVASESHRPMPINSGATAEVIALSDRERRLIDFLVDEALNEWWTQNSRD